jgi:hypothetical protein
VRLKGAGGRVISTGGEPVSMTFGTRPWRSPWRPILNNLFLILPQRLRDRRANGRRGHPGVLMRSFRERS